MGSEHKFFLDIKFTLKGCDSALVAVTCLSAWAVSQISQAHVVLLPYDTQIKELSTYSAAAFLARKTGKQAVTEETI